MKEKQGDKPKKPQEASKEIKKPLDASSVNKHKEHPLIPDEAFMAKEEEQKEEEFIDIEAEEAITEEVIENTKLAITNNNLDNVPINKINTPNQMLAFAEILVGAKMCPYKTPGDAVIAIMAGKELGLSTTATLQGIHPIEGRPSLGVHIKKAILLSKGVIFKKVHDMEEYYEFVDKKFSPPKVIGRGYLSDIPKFQEMAEGELGKAHIDTKTEYLFTRHFKTPKGIVTNTAIGVFSLAEANQAKLTTKNNWKNYTRDMLASRAFSRGANEIADDLLSGMYSYSELADLNDSVTYYIDENGHEQIVTD